MSKDLNLIEAEAVTMLRAANPKAWEIFESYLDRMYTFHREKCVDTHKDNDLEMHQGMARAFRKLTKLQETAYRVYEASKQQ
jgi:hypothetical protein